MCRSFTWAAGLLLLGACPARAQTNAQIWGNITALSLGLPDTVATLEAIRADAPRPLVALVRDCLEKDRAKLPRTRCAA